MTISSPGPNARVYWEMYGGLPVQGSADDGRIRVVDLTMKIGGYRAHEYQFYQVSVYSRANIDGENLHLLHRQTIDTDPGQMWKQIHIREAVGSATCRCVVVKVECKTPTHAEPTSEAPAFTYDDQAGTADPPPWGIKILKGHLYGNGDVMTDVRPSKILWAITHGYGFTVDLPPDTFTVDQLTFTEVPNDAWAGLDAVNDMLGFDYFCWDGTTIEFQQVGAGAQRSLSADDPGTVWGIETSLDETFNSVRVQYANKKGKPREVVVQANSPLTVDRQDTIQAPDSTQSAAQATKVGQRYMRDHADYQVQGAVTVYGNVGHDDALLFRPGDMLTMTGPARTIVGTKKVTRVTLNPLEWSATLEFGENSKRLDTWLARLAAGAKSIKRR